MAALTATAVGDRVSQGRYFEQTFNVTITNTGAADEWFVTGFREVVAVVGSAILGTAGLAATLNFVKNANGTGQSAGSTLGSLAIESGTAATVEVTVRGLA